MGQTYYITVFMSAVALVSSRLERLAVEKVCSSAKMDLQLIIDSSGSITDTGFHKMTNVIAKKILPNFNIGPEATRVAVFKYSQEHIMVNEFGLNKFSDLPSMQRAVEGIVFQPGQTFTAMAMHKALKAYQEEARSDPRMAKVCIVFTDGIANDESDVPAAHKAWADAGVIVFAVGILKNIRQPALERISGSSDRVSRASTIDSIGEITKSLLGQVCKAKEEPRLDPCWNNIAFEQGIAGASSIYHAPNRAEKGFSPLIKEKWWASGHKRLPAFIWYDFVEQSFSPAKVAFYPADYSYGSKQMPQDFQFIGSNDDVCNAGSTWTVLCEKRYPKNTVKEDETRGCEVDLGSGKPLSDFKFRCLGIKVLRVNRGRSSNVVALRGIQMWNLESC